MIIDQNKFNSNDNEYRQTILKKWIEEKKILLENAKSDSKIKNIKRELEMLEKQLK